MLERAYLVRTPESVVFSYLEAGPYTRFLAWSLDALIQTGVTIAGLMVLGLLTGLTMGLAQPLTYIYLFLVTSGYFVYCEWKMGGSSPGKRRFRMRVISEDGLKLTFWQSLVRNLLRIVDSLPILYGTAMATSLFSAHGRRLGDHVAGTLVITEPEAPAPRVIRAEAAALGLDPAFRERVRRRTTVEERDLAISAALRREELMLAARIGIFRDLATHFSARLGIEKPAHLSDERYVCDIAAALVG